MILILIVVSFIIWYYLYNRKQFTHPMSTYTMNQLKSLNYSIESQIDFAVMEELLLKYEYESIYTKNSPKIKEANALSEQIKNRFPGIDFTYHDDIILKQINNPTSKIDIYI